MLPQQFRQALFDERRRYLYPEPPAGLHDRAQTISWWLTEGQHTSVTYKVKGVQVEKKLDTAEDLYEYLLDDYDCQVAETTGNIVEVDEDDPEQMF